MNAKPWQTSPIDDHCTTMAWSYKHFTGRDLMPNPGSANELSTSLFMAPFVLVSAGPEADPILNFGNANALALWEMPWEQFIRTPGRLTAEAPLREERARFLAEVTTKGFIDNYSGIRISSTGKRFRIAQATVWTLLSPALVPCGQAARFDHWEWL